MHVLVLVALNIFLVIENVAFAVTLIAVLNPEKVHWSKFAVELPDNVIEVQFPLHAVKLEDWVALIPHPPFTIT
jgi:hypothetical protein